ncbi:MAG: NtrZ family periplasmic regulatory protein [Phenylobacterium sp.]
MVGRSIMSAAVSGLLLLGAASVAHAETKTPVPQASFTARDAFAPDLNQWGPQVGRRTLEWDSKRARFGVKLDLNQPLGRPLSYTDRDVQAGAYYKITPSFRVGGAVSLGAVNQEPQSAIPADRAPKVKLETAFKF